jgi:uncharacterized protein YdeI (YjbR/CyaY-like superfamily)
MKLSDFDQRIDAYIAKSADFAKPILEHLRQTVHGACPRVTETMKWSFPHFEYKGSILCSMAAFKQHCAFGFWLGALMTDPDRLLESVGTKTSMGHLGKITSLKDIPSKKILSKYIKEAMALIDNGQTKIARQKPLKSTPVKVPLYFEARLKKNSDAKVVFEQLSNSHKKEYVDWIADAKTDVTREKRITTAVEWLSEGKIRNWKYEKR